MSDAVIDVGTNSVKLLAGRLDRAWITRLGEGLERSGAISREAADRTLRVLKIARLLAGNGRIEAVGTRALRAARNAGAFLKRCREEAGVPVRVLSGREEARLGFIGAAGMFPGRRVAAIDIGGGSVEIMSGRGTRLDHSRSFPLGAVVLTERHLKSDPPAAEELEALWSEVRRRLRAGRAPGGLLVGIGGTVWALRRLLGVRPTRAALSDLAVRLSLLSCAERKRRGLKPGRADIIVAGAWTLVAAMDLMEAELLIPCPFGLRHGVLREMESSRRR